MCKKYFLLNENHGNDYHAGSKARVDADVIFSRYINIYNIHNYSLNNNTSSEEDKRIKYKFIRAYNCIRSIISLHNIKHNYIFAHYPDYSPFILSHVMNNLFSNNKMIYLVHDIDGIRYNNFSSREFKQLNEAYILIVHNRAMKKQLISLGITKPYFIELGLFDYLSTGAVQEKMCSKSVIFAGNLSKSRFLSNWFNLTRNYRIDLYGVRLQGIETLPPNVIYNGSYAPDILPCKFRGGLGLVWDGDTTVACTGNLGEYLRYNSPHKFSLYIAAGIPVIVWKHSAIASFVKKHNIGYAVESLNEINIIIENMQSDDYAILLNNIRPLQQKVRDGFFLSTAINNCISLK